MILHNRKEFEDNMPEIPKANVKSRSILTPEHAKRWLPALQENIQKYAAVNGSIKNARGHDPFIPPMSFGGPAPIA